MEEEREKMIHILMFGISNCWQKTKEICLSYLKNLVRIVEHCTAGKLFYVILMIFSNKTIISRAPKFGEMPTYNVFDFYQNYWH